MFLLTTLNAQYSFLYDHLVYQFDLCSQNMHWILTVMATKKHKNVLILKQQKNTAPKNLFFTFLHD